MKPPSLLIAERVLPDFETVTALAEALGINRVSASNLVNGRYGISPRIALALERMGYGDARQWMFWQADWDLEQERAGIKPKHYRGMTL
jgi:addiction module HigA family antidote